MVNTLKALAVAAAALALLAGTASAEKAEKATRDDLSAQSRARITIHPRQIPGPDSKRHCRSWLAKEYRVSGTVIVPRMQCWWD